MGGDEFVLVLRAPKGQADEAAWAVAHRARRAIAEPYEVDGKPVRVGCSLGGASWPEHAADGGLAAVMEKADAAMYDVKRSGKGRIRFYGKADVVALETT